MDFDLSLGATGVRLADIDLRLYAGLVSVGVPVGVTLTAASTGIDYVLSGMPEGEIFNTFTYVYPPGVGFYQLWVGQDVRPIPAFIIIPLRVGGQANSIDVALFLNGNLSTVPLTIVEVGSPGDYAVYGWPVPQPGERWLLRWTINSVHYRRNWSIPAVVHGVSTIISDLADMFSDDLVVETVAADAYGQFSVIGAPLTIRCHIEGNSKQVRDKSGQDVVSNLQIITAGYFSLTTDRHRYTVPSRYSSRVRLEALAIDKESDENGPCYEEIML